MACLPGLLLGNTTCTYNAAAPVLHAEGLAEQIGDISVNCGGGVGITTSIVVVQLNGNITNRVDANGNITGVSISGGASAGTAPSLTATNSILFDGVQVQPGTVSFKISGIRVAIPTITQSSGNVSVTATLIGSTLGITGAPALAGVAGPTLLASVLNYGVPCAGSPAPATIDFPGLLTAGTSVSAIRVTQASQGVFAAKTGNADSGTRFLVNLSGYGTKAQVYVPDVITGNAAPTPTSAGQFNTAANPGAFAPNNNQVLLARVGGADANGAGGVPVLQSAPVAATNFTSVTQVPLVGGAGTVTYEVIVSNPIVTNSAQIPVFVAVPAGNCSAPLQNTLTVQVAPVSNVSTPTQNDPIPRFVAATPGSDCSVFQDCSAAYFPALQVAPATLSLSSTSLGPQQNGFITITDGGSQTPQLNFTVSVAYQPTSGSTSTGWLSVNGSVLTGSSPFTINGLVNPAAGISSFVLPISASPASLAPGTYQALVTVNAGNGGNMSASITFTVGPAGPVIQSIVNSANGQPGPVTAESFATIYGVNLAASKSLTVTFDGLTANVSYDGQLAGSSTSQINVLVPAALSNMNSAGVIATVDGVASNTFAVKLAPNAPAVFNPGILNQDNTVNLGTQPASRGDIIQIFLTGVSSSSSALVSVKAGDQTLSGAQILYSGAVPSIPGLEQVNVQIPTGLTLSGTSVPLSVCVPDATGQAICSNPVNLFLH